MTRRNHLCALLVISLGAACSPVSQVRIRDDYALSDQRTVHRVTVVSSPTPAAGESLGRLMSLQAARYMNHHREFIVHRAETGDEVPEDSCGQGAEAVLVLAPGEATLQGGRARLAVSGSLSRCADGVEIWGARIADTWPSDDPELRELTASYVRELGDTVAPWAAPSFRMVRLLLDTLPRPILEDDDKIMEKIELEL